MKRTSVPLADACATLTDDKLSDLGVARIFVRAAERPTLVGSFAQNRRDGEQDYPGEEGEEPEDCH